MTKKPATVPPPDGIEHRQHARVSVRQRVWCEGDHVTLYVQATNVSAGGLFVRAASPPDVGERLKISFADKDADEIVARVEVAWRRGGGKSDVPPGMGLRIVGFEKGEEAYRRFVKRMLSGDG